MELKWRACCSAPTAQPEQADEGCAEQGETGWLGNGSGRCVRNQHSSIAGVETSDEHLVSTGIERAAPAPAAAIPAPASAAAITPTPAGTAQAAATPAEAAEGTILARKAAACEARIDAAPAAASRAIVAATVEPGAAPATVKIAAPAAEAAHAARAREAAADAVATRSADLAGSAIVRSTERAAPAARDHQWRGAWPDHEAATAATAANIAVAPSAAHGDVEHLASCEGEVAADLSAFASAGAEEAAPLGAEGEDGVGACCWHDERLCSGIGVAEHWHSRGHGC